MGWNSWNHFGKKAITEEIMREVIEAMDTTGLREAGYEYVVIDGGWRDVKLGENGELLAHPEKFPNGIKPLADYAHSKGLKFGLHTVPGTADCIGDPVGGFGHEEIQIQQFVDWGIDFIKLDACIYEAGWTEQILKDTYVKWGRLLDEISAGTITLSISGYKFRDWNPDLCTMSRTTGDIGARVGGMTGTDAKFDGAYNEDDSAWKLWTVMEIAEQNSKWAEFAGNGYWNDPDMLATGDHGMTIEEQKSHFALWCIMSSPLMLGNDPRNMTEQERSIILNEKAIAINQDPSEQGKRISQNGDVEVWAKKLTNGDYALLLLNRNPEEARTISLNLSDLGFDGSVTVTSVYEGVKVDVVDKMITQKVSPSSSAFLSVAL